MKFKGWVDQNISEADWKSWFGNVGDKFKQAGRVLGNWSPVNADTINTYPGRYEQPQQQSQRGRPVSPMLGGSGGTPTPQNFGTAAPQKQSVGFRAADLDNVKVAITDYLGMISRYMEFVIQQLQKINPRLGQGAATNYEQKVAPSYAKLRGWVGWVNNKKMELANYKAQRNAPREHSILEGVNVKHTDFEAMKADMQNMSNAMRTWVQLLANNLPPEHARRFQAVYDKHVVQKQGILAQQLLWIDRKLQQLMNMHNIPYKGIA